ncbi:type II and III secretion system protein family protein [Sandaracinobacter sp. RS1-74]|uniref:type II and III secretion system protein family protein n=1 Tax=Sandaracinobacteroides sayramensis TaxID=2913411 RepID=UPI001EDA71A0|nr:type II and III secretion system protein family protein [Sandaracinobacteroides sayramensis]MCG2840573.1 type II and III secretion system protein family protein [Sandaracinobacteroides sayramensis]
MRRNSLSPKPVRAALVAALFAAALSFPGVPAELKAQTISTGDARAGAVMAVPVNKSQVLKLDRAFAKAMIGNPEIADVMPLNANSVYVLGRATGSTNLALYDRGGNLIAVVDVVVGPDVLGLKRQISEMFPGEPVRISNSNDALVLEGQVSSPLAAERIMALASTYAPEKVLNLMSVGSPQQVLLEVRVSEMSRGTVKQLGLSQVSWNGGSVVGNSNMESGPYIGRIAGLFGTSLDIQFEALERQGLIRTLANPNLVALSGESANFLAGGELPIPSGVDRDGRLSVEFKPFGVAVAFTPTVLADGLINLRVAPEVSSIDREVAIQLSGTSIPGLKVRRAITSLELRDGQSFAMAGLIQSDYANSVRGVPLLGKLPIIGALFRSTSFQKNETELVIVVTPRIVRPVRADQVALPTDRVREPGAMDLFLLGKTEKVVPLSPSSSPKPGGVDGESGHIVR